MHEYWFFLSYARTDKIGGYVRRFHKDLSEEIRRRVPLPASIEVQKIGFWDEREIEVGDNWPDSIAAALQGTRTLVCLYSRAYFASQYCGKEFELFRRRLFQANPAALPLIMPILWDPPRELPKPLPGVVSQVQYTQGSFGEAYAEHGLYRLIRLSKHRDDYRSFILAFAEQLQLHAKEFNTPRLQALPALSQIDSPFHVPMISDGGHTTHDSSRGPGAVHFYFFAGRKSDLLSVKTNVTPYSMNGGHDWRPFLPKHDETAGLISQRAASQAKLISEMCKVEENFVTGLSKAEEENTIALILVDPWTAKLRFYQDRLQDFDRTRFVNCAVLVLWNERDAETRNNLNALQQGVIQALSRHSASEDPCFRDLIKSADGLRIEIGAAIIEIRRKLMRRANILRTAVGTGTPLPSISGAEASSNG